MPRCGNGSRCSSLVASAISAGASQTSYLAASVSASRWRVRWSNNRKLLLLDEPLGALDRKLREHTQFELVNIQERLGSPSSWSPTTRKRR